MSADTPPPTLASLLSAERVRQGLTLPTLAERSGLSLSRVHGILSGDTPNPGILTVRAILAGLGRDLGWLGKRWPVLAGSPERGR